MNDRFHKIIFLFNFYLFVSEKKIFFLEMKWFVLPYRQLSDLIGFDSLSIVCWFWIFYSTHVAIWFLYRIKTVCTNDLNTIKFIVFYCFVILTVIMIWIWLFVWYCSIYWITYNIHSTPIYTMCTLNYSHFICRNVPSNNFDVHFFQNRLKFTLEK